jgi:hypothetical protein
VETIRAAVAEKVGVVETAAEFYKEARVRQPEMGRRSLCVMLLKNVPEPADRIL